jgi:FkbM family methyltransferase
MTRDTTIEASRKTCRAPLGRRAMHRVVSGLPERVQRRLSRIASLSLADWLTARALERLIANPNLRVALFDSMTTVLKFPRDAAELVEDLRAGMIADIAPMLLKLEPWLPADSIALVVGACRGVAVQWLADRARRVYAFEPQPENVSSIKDALHARKVENVEIVNAAVFDQIGRRPFRLCGARENSSLGPVRSSGIADPIEVASTTLDEFCRNRGIDVVDFLKIDADGFEYEVLGGARELLAGRNIRLILFARVPLTSFGKSVGPIRSLLSSYRYGIFDLDGNPAPEERLRDCGRADLLAMPQG